MAFWLDHRPPETLLIVLTDGTIAWDSTAADFDWAKTDALPKALERRAREEPNYLDLRWVQDGDGSVAPASKIPGRRRRSRRDIAANATR